MKTGQRRVIDTPVRDDTRTGVLLLGRSPNPRYWGHLEHRSERSLKPADHTEQGLYAHGPDEDANSLWEQQTENLLGLASPSRAAALGPQQIKRGRARRARRQVSPRERQLQLVRAIFPNGGAPGRRSRI